MKQFSMIDILEKKAIANLHESFSSIYNINIIGEKDSIELNFKFKIDVLSAHLLKYELREKMQIQQRKINKEKEEAKQAEIKALREQQEELKSELECIEDKINYLKGED